MPAGVCKEIKKGRNAGGKRIEMEKKRIEKTMEEVREENVTEEIMRIGKIRKKKKEKWLGLKIMPIMLVMAVAGAAGLTVGGLAGDEVGAGNGADASWLTCETVMAADGNGSSSTTGGVLIEG